LDIVVVGTDQALYRKVWNAMLVALRASRRKPSAAGSSPAIGFQRPGRLDVFMVGDDQGLGHKAFESGKWQPSLDFFEQIRPSFQSG